MGEVLKKNMSYYKVLYNVFYRLKKDFYEIIHLLRYLASSSCIISRSAHFLKSLKVQNYCC